MTLTEVAEKLEQMAEAEVQAAYQDELPVGGQFTERLQAAWELREMAETVQKAVPQKDFVYD